MKHRQKIINSEYNKNTVNQNSLLKILEKKLENSKKIFKTAGRLEEHKVLAIVMNENVKDQNKLNIDHFSYGEGVFGHLICRVVAEGEVDIVADIITNYLGIDFKYTEAKLSILQLACGYSNIKIARLYIDLKHNGSNSISSIVNWRDNESRGYLFFLILGNHSRNKIKTIEIIDYFCELGVNLNAKCSDGNNIILDILFITSREKKLDEFFKEIVRHLIKKGANFKEKTQGDFETIYSLLGEKEELNILKNLVKERVFSEIRKPKIDYKNIKRVLDENDFEPDSVDERGCNMLHYAAHHGCARDLPTLLHIQNINKKDKYGMTPVMYAAKNAKIDDVLYLERQGVDVTIANNAGETLAHYAAGRGWIKVLSLLERIELEGGEKFLSIRTNKGHLPIHRASFHGHLDAVEYLLCAGQDINAVTDDGNTALHIAAMESNPMIYCLLLSKGADHNIKNNLGKKASDIIIMPTITKKTEAASGLSR